MDLTLDCSICSFEDTLDVNGCDIYEVLGLDTCKKSDSQYRQLMYLTFHLMHTIVCTGDQRHRTYSLRNVSEQ